MELLDDGVGAPVVRLVPRGQDDLDLQADAADRAGPGSTLSLDENATRQFDFMLSNPPYGKSWKTDAEKMGGKKDILDSRFNAYMEGGEQLAMIPRTSGILKGLSWLANTTNYRTSTISFTSSS